MKNSDADFDQALEDLIHRQQVLLGEIRVQKDDLSGYLDHSLPLPAAAVRVAQPERLDPRGSDEISNAAVFKFQAQVLSDRVAELQSENQILEEKVIQLSSELAAGESLFREVNSKNQIVISDKLKVLQVKLHEITERMKMRTEYINNLTNEKNDLAFENLKMKERSQQLSAEAEQLRIKLAEVETSTTEATALLQKGSEKDRVMLNIKIASLEGMLKSSEKQLFEKNRNLNNLADEREDLSRRLMAKEKESQILARELEIAQKETAGIEQKIETAVAERNDSLEKQVVRLESRLESLKKSAVTEHEGNVLNYRAYIDSLENEVKELSKLNHNKDRHLQNVLKDRHFINEELVEREQKYKELKGNFVDIVQNRKQIEKAIEQKILETKLPLETEIKTLKTRLKDKSSDEKIAFSADEKFKQRIQELTDKLAMAEKKLDEQASVSDKTKAEVKAEEMVEERNSEIQADSAPASVELIGSAAAMPSKKSVQLAAKLKESEKERAALQSEVKLLKHQLKEVIEEGKIPLKEEIVMLEQKIKRLDKEKKQLLLAGGDVSEVARRLEEFNEKIVSLEQEKEQLMNENSRLTEQLEEFHNQQQGILPLDGGLSGLDAPLGAGEHRLREIE
jgi:chromosome segregation ATPase